MRWLYWKDLKIHTIVISGWRLIEKKSRVTFFFIKFIVYDPSWRVIQIWTNQTICWQIRQLAVLSSISFIQSWCFSTIESKYKYFKTNVNKNLLVSKYKKYLMCLSHNIFLCNGVLFHLTLLIKKGNFVIDILYHVTLNDCRSTYLSQELFARKIYIFIYFQLLTRM